MSDEETAPVTSRKMRRYVIEDEAEETVGTEEDIERAEILSALADKKKKQTSGAVKTEKGGVQRELSEDEEEDGDEDGSEEDSEEDESEYEGEEDSESEKDGGEEKSDEDSGEGGCVDEKPKKKRTSSDVQEQPPEKKRKVEGEIRDKPEGEIGGKPEGATGDKTGDKPGGEASSGHLRQRLLTGGVREDPSKQSRRAVVIVWHRVNDEFDSRDDKWRARRVMVMYQDEVSAYVYNYLLKVEVLDEPMENPDESIVRWFDDLEFAVKKGKRSLDHVSSPYDQWPGIDFDANVHVDRVVALQYRESSV